MSRIRRTPKSKSQSDFVNRVTFSQFLGSKNELGSFGDERVKARFSSEIFPGDFQALHFAIFFGPKCESRYFTEVKIFLG